MKMDYSKALYNRGYRKGHSRGYREGINIVLSKIRAELIDAIQNGTLKIECGNETLFNIIDKYRAGNEEGESYDNHI